MSRQNKLVGRFGNEHVRSHRRYVDSFAMRRPWKDVGDDAGFQVKTAIARVLKETEGYIRRLQDRW